VLLPAKEKTLPNMGVSLLENDLKMARNSL